MKKTSLATISSMQPLAWSMPLPEWPSLKLASKPLQQTYTISNQSDVAITITGIGFTPGNDVRVGLVGGTCRIGLVLAPHDACTIEVQINPMVLGPGQQTLNIEHSGNFSPLWTDLLFSVVVQGETRVVKTSYLAEDTRSMDRQRRLLEQEGHRHYARVHAREHPEVAPAQMMAQEGELQNNIQQNPWLNSQRFDGIDPNLNPEPPLNTEARREFDNERREQEMEKQLRLGNVPRISSAPKPQGF
ncbi:MAG TPA: hypothetical protein VHD33_05915 [Legionellaceae bacterium]|nr:hypothetical protein [Legionellaceae bacterium]